MSIDVVVDKYRYIYTQAVAELVCGGLQQVSASMPPQRPLQTERLLQSIDPSVVKV